MKIVLEFKYERLKCGCVIEPIQHEFFRSIYIVSTLFYDEHENIVERTFRAVDKDYIKKRLRSCRRRKGKLRIIKENTVTYNVEYT